MGLTALLVLGLIAGVVYQSRQVSSAHHRIALLEADKVDLQRRLAYTRTELKSAQALASLRKRVLLQAQRVVKQVDPVLSSADSMQVLTSQMQDEQASFAENSDAVIGYLATMVDYLARNSPLYWDISYINSTLDQAIAYYDAAQGDESALASLSSRYSGATKRFEGKATQFTLAVERLQKQLASATK